MNNKVLLAIIFVGGIVALAIGVRHWLAIDRCLDLGGRWNYESGICAGAKM
jgi:hypothetical protein